jgi:hypothetical protein
MRNRRRLARGPLFLLLVGCSLGAFSLTFTHLAGSFGGPGFEDGTTNAARFKSDAALAIDAWVPRSHAWLTLRFGWVSQSDGWVRASDAQVHRTRGQVPQTHA